MAEKDTVMETEEKEVISKNFIEQEIDKDLAEGVYSHVQTRFPAGTKRLFTHRARQVHITQLRSGTEVRWKVQPAF